jgi:uncharacterized protein YndB with AHSA1/START domain
VAPIITTVEIARPPDEVFAYVTDPSRFIEWQPGIVSGRIEGGGPTRVGSKCVTTRRIGGSERTTTQEITEFEPPIRWADHGVDGPIRGRVQVDVEPIDRNAGSRVTLTVDFEGHGIGRLLVPLFVRPQARKDIPVCGRNLKERLEAPDR